MSDQLSANQRLAVNESLTSANGRFRLLYQPDGNVVLYRSDGTVKWSSGTQGKSAGFCIMQSDGNFVVYDATQVPVFDSGTQGHVQSHLIVQNDGNLVVYTPAMDPVWASNTAEAIAPPGGRPASCDRIRPGEVLHPGESIFSANGKFHLIYQRDGNLVIYQNGSDYVWDTKKNGTSAGVLIFQTDGNLVVYDAGSFPVWASNTKGKGGTEVIMQDDGNLVMYGPGRRVLWQSDTPYPSISDFSPKSGPAKFLIKITGINFIGVEHVLFNGMDALSFGVESGNLITALVPPGASSGPISVVRKNRKAVSKDAFRVLDSVQGSNLFLAETWMETTNGDTTDFPHEGNAFTINFHVVNTGDTPSGKCTARLVLDRGAREETVVLEPLQSGKVQALSISFSTGLKAGDHLVECFVDAKNEVPEGSESDNYLSHGFEVLAGRMSGFSFKPKSLKIK